MEKEIKDLKEVLFTTYIYKIILHLSTNSSNISNISKILGKQYSSVIRHLQYLEDVGVLNTTKEGRERHYQLTNEGLKLANLLEDVVEFCDNFKVQK